MTAICLWVIVAAGASTMSITMIMAALTYAGIQGLHHYAFSSLPASDYAAYYLSAMTVDALSVGVMLLVAGAIGKDWHLWPLSIILCLSIVNDIYGLAAWRAYAVPETFNAIGYAIYAAIAVVLAGSRYSANLVKLFRRSPVLRGESVRGNSVGAKSERSCKT